MAADVPTEQDCGDWRADPDIRDAHDAFAGRTAEEVKDLLRSNVIERSSDLKWMPALPFRYYMLGFRDHVMSGDFDPLWAGDTASCYLGMIEEKLRETPEDILPIMPLLLPSIEHIAENQAAYKAPVHIYGDFKNIRAAIKNLYGNA